MLPHLDEDFGALTEMSMQERRYALGRLIDRQLFFETFVSTIENGEKSDLLEMASKLNSLGGSVAKKKLERGISQHNFLYQHREETRKKRL